jgi:hypothetical protein
MNFLGHVLFWKGMKLNPKKIQIIKKWQSSTITKGLRSFLGLVNFYKKLIMKDIFDVGQTTFQPL